MHFSSRYSYFEGNKLQHHLGYIVCTVYVSWVRDNSTFSKHCWVNTIVPSKYNHTFQITPNTFPVWPTPTCPEHSRSRLIVSNHLSGRRYRMLVYIGCEDPFCPERHAVSSKRSKIYTWGPNCHSKNWERASSGICCHDFLRSCSLSLFGRCWAGNDTDLLAIADTFFIIHWFCLVFRHTWFHFHQLHVVYSPHVLVSNYFL